MGALTESVAVVVHVSVYRWGTDGDGVPVVADGHLVLAVPWR